jgi:hypothetical protein
MTFQRPVGLGNVKAGRLKSEVRRMKGGRMDVRCMIFDLGQHQFKTPTLHFFQLYLTLCTLVTSQPFLNILRSFTYR